MFSVQFNRKAWCNFILSGFLLVVSARSAEQPPPAYKIVVDDFNYKISVLDTSRSPHRKINEFTSDYRISGYELKDVCPLPGEEIILKTYDGGSGGEARYITILAQVFEIGSMRPVFSHLESYEGPGGVFHNIEFRHEEEYVIYVDDIPFVWDGTKFVKSVATANVTILDSLPSKDVAIAYDPSSSQLVAIRSFSSEERKLVELPIEFGDDDQAKIIDWRPQPLLLIKNYLINWSFRETYLTIYTDVFTADSARIIARLPIAADGGAGTPFFYLFAVAVDPRPFELRLLVYPGKSSGSDLTVPPEPVQNQELEAPLQYVWDTVTLVKTGQVVRLADYPNVGIELSMPDEPIRIHRFFGDSSVVVNKIPGGAKNLIGDFSPVDGPELVVWEVESGYKWCFDYRVRIYANFWHPDSTRLILDDRLDRVSLKYIYVPTAEPPKIWTFVQEECWRFPEIIIAEPESLPDTTEATYVWVDSVFAAKNLSPR